MNAGEQIVLEEIFLMWMSEDGKRERKTRSAIAALIGERRAETLRRQWLVERAASKQETK